MKIQITFVLDDDDEYADPNDDMGVTEEAYMLIMDSLSFGDDIQIEKVD